MRVTRRGDDEARALQHTALQVVRYDPASFPLILFPHLSVSSAHSVSLVPSHLVGGDVHSELTPAIWPPSISSILCFLRPAAAEG